MVSVCLWCVAHSPYLLVTTGERLGLFVLWGEILRNDGGGGVCVEVQLNNFLTWLCA